MGKEGRNEQSKTTKVRCPAMVEAGILDPDSYDGIQFCTKQCPYPDCIAFSGDAAIIRMREDEARRLQDNGYSISQISRELHIARSTIVNYLGRAEKRQ